VEAAEAVEAIGAAEHESVGQLLSLTQDLGVLNLSEPIQLTATVETESGVITATAVSPAAADENGFVSITAAAGSDADSGGVALAVPAAVLSQALGGSTGEGLPMLTVGVMDEDLADKLKAAGEAESSNGEVGPTLTTKPVSIKLYYSNGTEMKHVQLAEPMLITIDLPELTGNTSVDDLKCAYWDEDLSAWSDKGVERVPDKNGTLICKTHHLTIFGAIVGEFKKLAEDVLQALVCSNANALMSREGLEALLKDTGWWYWPPSIVLWIVFGLSACVMGLTAIVDWRESQKMPWDERRLMYRSSMEKRKSFRRSRSMVSQSRNKRSRVVPEVPRLTRSNTSANLQAGGRGSLWVLQEVLGLDFDFSAFLKDMKDMDSGLLNKCVRLVHTRRSSMDEASLKSLLTLDGELHAQGVVPSAAQERSLRTSVSSLVEEKSVRSSGKEAADTFLSTCFCTRAAYLFLALHPLMALFNFSIRLSRSARLALLLCKIFMSAAAAAMFFEASGGALGQDADPDCIPREGLLTEIIQAVTVGMVCAMIGDGSVVVLGMLQKHELWRCRCTYFRVAIFWLLWTAQFSGSTLFIAIFLANVNQASSVDWLHSSMMSLFEEMVLMPLAISAAYAICASAVLCCRPHAAEKIRSSWEKNEWADEDEDAAEELAAEIDGLEEEEDMPELEAEEDMPELEARQEQEAPELSDAQSESDALAALRGGHHSGLQSSGSRRSPSSPRSPRSPSCSRSPRSPWRRSSGSASSCSARSLNACLAGPNKSQPNLSCPEEEEKKSSDPVDEIIEEFMREVEQEEDGVLSPRSSASRRPTSLCLSILPEQ